MLPGQSDREATHMLDAVPDIPLPLHKTAGRDLIDGARRVELWARLGWLEVKRRYRRTVIGPFWSVISLAIFVGTMGAVGAGLWNLDLHTYLPYLTAGMVVWTLISASLGEACGVFIGNANLFRNARCDFSLLAFALVWRNLLVFLHHLMVYVLVTLALAPHYLLNPMVLLIIPGVALLALNGIWITLLLGMACLRFRDIQQIVLSVLQIGLLMTPILWPAEQLAGQGRLFFVHFNPMHHCVELVRAPLLGAAPSAESYLAVAGLAMAGWAVTYWLFGRFRARIPYWS
jgi:ABC-type polysaccharide/polyol phosphate export permease